MTWFEQLKEYDKELMLFLNGKHNGFFDWLMSAMSNMYIWVPLYLFLVFIVYKEYGRRRALLYLVFWAAVVGAADWLSVVAFKEVFMRWRPCHNLDIGHLLHTINDKCGGRYGFVSSHATNHFAVAWFIGLVLWNRNKWWMYGMLIWAAIIAYSRIYLGVHYPSDVIAGSLLGSGIAIFFYWIYDTVKKRRRRRWEQREQ